MATLQSLSGTGSLRVAAEFIAKFLPGKTAYLSNPTWGNHKVCTAFWLLMPHALATTLTSGLATPQLCQTGMMQRSNMWRRPSQTTSWMDTAIRLIMPEVLQDYESVF